MHVRVCSTSHPVCKGHRLLPDTWGSHPGRGGACISAYSWATERPWLRPSSALTACEGSRTSWGSISSSRRMPGALRCGDQAPLQHQQPGHPACPVRAQTRINLQDSLSSDVEGSCHASCPQSRLPSWRPPKSNHGPPPPSMQMTPGPNHTVPAPTYSQGL